MNLIKIIMDLLNGHKLNTGTIIIIAVMVLQQLGIEKEIATQITTNIMLGVGGVFMLWGYIHRIIKAWRARKLAAK